MNDCVILRELIDRGIWRVITEEMLVIVTSQHDAINYSQGEIDLREVGARLCAKANTSIRLSGGN